MDFVQGIIPANRAQILILIGIIAVGIGILAIRHRIRYILVMPFLAGALFVLAMLIFPLYEEGPNTQITPTQTNMTLHIFPNGTTSTSSLIHVKEENSTAKILSTKNTTQQTLRKNVAQQILFISTETSEKAQCRIQFSDGSLLQIFPQSAIFLQVNDAQIEVKVLQGRANYLASDAKTPTKFQGVDEIDKTANPFASALINKYETEKVKSVQQEAGGVLASNETANQISKFLLQVLSKLFPLHYTKNLDNYYAFQQYKLATTQPDITRSDISDQAIQEDIFVQTNKGRKETKIYQRLQQLFR